ncbi:hypothetical protein MTO96_003087 [Rhipicephalus appendiculatus]
MVRGLTFVALQDASITILACACHGIKGDVAFVVAAEFGDEVIHVAAADASMPAADFPLTAGLLLFVRAAAVHVPATAAAPLLTSDLRWPPPVSCSVYSIYIVVGCSSVLRRRWQRLFTFSVVLTVPKPQQWGPEFSRLVMVLVDATLPCSAHSVF